MKKYLALIMVISLFCCMGGSCHNIEAETTQSDTSEATFDSTSSLSSLPVENTEETIETESSALQVQESLVASEPHGNSVFDQQLTDCSSDIPLDDNELYEAVSDSRIATVVYLYTGERDEFQEQIISGSIILLRDISGNVVKELSFDYSLYPQVIFDQNENLHIFFSTEKTTKHYVYSSEGELLDERSFDLDHYVYVMGEVAFDDLDRMYVIKTEYSERILANIHTLMLYTAEGELINSKNIGNEEKIVSIDGIVYLLSRRDQQVGLKTALDILSNVRSETEWIDISTYRIYSAEGGMCFVKIDGDTLKESVWSYDIYSGDTYELIQDMGNKYFIRMSCSTSRICLIVAGTDGKLYSYLYQETE